MGFTLNSLSMRLSQTTDDIFLGEMTLNAVLSIDGLDLEERQMAELLECRYGDGMVYLPRTRPRQLLSIAKNSGFIDAEGYLTRKGRILLSRYF